MSLLQKRTLGGLTFGDHLGQIGAWAVISAGGTSKLHSSFNVSSLTQNANGDHTVTYARAMNASAYAVFVTAQTAGFRQAWTDNGNLPTATSVRILTLDSGTTLTNYDPTTVVVTGEF